MVLLTLRLNSLCSLQLLRKRRLFLLDQGLQLFPVFIQKAYNGLAGFKEGGMKMLIQVGIVRYFMGQPVSLEAARISL